MSYVTQAASDYNEFKRKVANRFQENQSIDKKIENVLQNKKNFDDEDEIKKEEMERIMSFFLKGKL